MEPKVYLAKYDVKHSDFAKQCEMSETYLSKVLNGNYFSPGIYTCGKMVKASGGKITYEAMFKKAKELKKKKKNLEAQAEE